MISGRSDLVDVEATFIRSTDLAWLVRSHVGDCKEVWLPKSIVEVDDEDEPKVFTMPRRIAEEKELV